MPNPRGKVTVGTVIDVDLQEKIDERAAREKRSRSNLIELACRFYLQHAAVTVNEPRVPDIARAK